MYYRVLFTDSEEHEPRITVTEDPAIEVKALMLKKDEKPVKLSTFHKFNDEKQILSGLALIADKWIYRYDKETDKEYYIMFTPDQIALYKDAFLNNGSKINFEHTDRMIEAEVLQCCLIGEEELKYPIDGNPKEGDLYLAIQIKNSNDWKEIKAGKHNAYSIEGVFNHRLIEFKGDKRMVADETIQEDILKYLKERGVKKPDNWTEVSEQEYLNAKENHLTTDPTARDSVNDISKGDGTGQWLVRYEYSGPIDSKNRSFCARIMAMGRLYTEEEIKNGLFNPEFGNYSVWDYKGSYGCRHVWKRKIFFEDYEDNEVRRVGAVPQVTATLDDQDARTLNANLKSEIMTKEEKEALKDELRKEILQDISSEKEEEKEVDAEKEEEKDVKAEKEKEEYKEEEKEEDKKVTAEEEETAPEEEVKERESEDSEEEEEFKFTEEMYNTLLESIAEIKGMITKGDEEEEMKKEEMSVQQKLSKEAQFLADYPRH